MSPDALGAALDRFPVSAIPSVKAAVLAFVARLCPRCCQPAPVRTTRGRTKYLRCACGWKGKVVAGPEDGKQR